jgi:cell division protein FtsW (lipid II flippase)
MTRSELEALTDKVRRRHNRRVLTFFGLVLFVFAFGLFFMPVRFNRSERGSWMLTVVAMDLIVALAGIGWTLRADKDLANRILSR